MDNRIVYLNGAFLPVDEAKVSVMDRGFLFGDGVYEVVLVYDGRPVGLDGHIKRLQSSLDGIKLEFAACESWFNPIFKELLDRNSANEGSYTVYLEVTRGSAPSRSHGFPDKVSPTVFMDIKKIQPISYSDLKNGKSAITVDDIRWKYCNIKSISLLPSVLLFQQAKDAGADEAILIHDGYAIEGTSSNLFIVKNGVIITPALSHENLSGVTREAIIQLAAANSIGFREEKILENDLFYADEVWVASSTRGIFPIVKINGRMINNGKVGDIWDRMIKLYLGTL